MSVLVSRNNVIVSFQFILHSQPAYTLCVYTDAPNHHECIIHAAESMSNSRLYKNQSQKSASDIFGGRKRSPTGNTLSKIKYEDRSLIVNAQSKPECLSELIQQRNVQGDVAQQRHTSQDPAIRRHVYLMSHKSATPRRIQWSGDCVVRSITSAM